MTGLLEMLLNAREQTFLGCLSPERREEYLAGELVLPKDAQRKILTFIEDATKDIGNKPKSQNPGGSPNPTTSYNVAVKLADVP